MEPPPITVVIPGRGAVGAELLAVGDPVPRTPVPPSRWVGLSAVAVLVAGVAQVVTYDAPPAPPAVVAPAVTGVTASAVPVDTFRGGPLDERFGLDVVVAPPGSRGDSGSPSEQDQVSLLAVSGRGFFFELVGPSTPVPLGPQDRRGATVSFEVRAQVSDCAVDSQAQRNIELQIRQGLRSGPVQVSVDDDVVRLLDRLVARSCRRPRG